MAARAEDPLAAINDHIRSQGVTDDSSSQWLALESNPDVFNPFCSRIGLPSGWGFVDVLGLDEELLRLVPTPTVACVLLFPCTDRIYKARRQEDAELRDDGPPQEDLFFLRQVEDFGNACGTIACLHAVANSRQWVALDAGAPLESFIQAQASATPEERGEALLKQPVLRAASDDAAATPAAQTILPDRDGPPLDHHFAAFVRSPGGRLFELDGTKRWPVDHGPTTADGFVFDAAATMRKRFVDVDPDVHGFAFMALT
eukprot:CAMPEP_0117510518 /NCGR_PEP_ID=MMETSP0784-20121206/28031_1 /TAXON_ID=39447 /ORGANISM="" /LENGTH=257 /DNA_ID=CAMNT_0005306157 /DNA_START=63 /DNA_END=832 /DNA_ORIENTATION=-